MTALVEFRMPDVGEGIAEAELLDWFVEVGDDVEADALLCQVQTDKSIVEIPAPATGTVLKRGFEAGEIAKVGDLLVVIGGAGAQPVDSGSTEPRRRPLASPHTRRLAVRRGIDLTMVTGTGPHGRILETDLDLPTPVSTSPSTTFTATSAGPVREDQVIELRGLRRSIARHMTEALSIPHVTEFREVDATKLLAARAALKPSFDSSGVRFSVLPLLLKAVMRALASHPSMNATFDAVAETVTQYSGVHLGIATATDDGLVVPVVRDADLLDLTDLTLEVERLAERARTRTATADELTEGSFTVTNFGSFGTWMGNPVIRPPEVGIAGFGRITDRVVAVDGQAVVRPILPIVVATDHRINDGAHLADFVNDIAAAVAEPLLLLA